MKNRITCYHLLIVLAIFFFLPRSYADCSASSSTTSLGTSSSFDIATDSMTVESGTGFTCSGSLLSIASTNTITATISSTTNDSQLQNASTDTYLPYSICSDSSCSTTYSAGDSITWSSTTLVGILGLFNSSDGTLPIYIRTSTGSNLPAGTYTDTITINWDYSICFVGVFGVCVYTTGTATSTINVTLIVTDYCYIDSAPDIDFGTTALPSGFSSISSSISVRCTLDSSYTVNLTSTNAESGDWRQMLASVDGSNYYLQYQLALGSGTIWSSINDYSDTGTGTSQNIAYTATVNSSQDTVPAGNYSDTITVTVSY